jgi:hypothetical protein
MQKDGPLEQPSLFFYGEDKVIRPSICNKSTDTQIASLGLTEETAKQQKLNTSTVDADMSGLDGPDSMLTDISVTLGL